MLSHCSPLSSLSKVHLLLQPVPISPISIQTCGTVSEILLKYRQEKSAALSFQLIPGVKEVVQTQPVLGKNHVHNPFLFFFFNSLACKQLTGGLVPLFSRGLKKRQPDLSSLDPFTCLFESEWNVYLFPLVIQALARALHLSLSSAVLWTCNCLQIFLI